MIILAIQKNNYKVENFNEYDKIPKIIHQTWKTNNVPEKCKEWVKSWKEKNPGWDYRLWTDEDNRNLIKEYFPKFLKIYDSFYRTVYFVRI